eukprot:6702415-Alexandrium_andersonii.AAC.1
MQQQGLQEASLIAEQALFSIEAVFASELRNSPHSGSMEPSIGPARCSLFALPSNPPTKSGFRELEHPGLRW